MPVSICFDRIQLFDLFWELPFQGTSSRKASPWRNVKVASKTGFEVREGLSWYTLMLVYFKIAIENPALIIYQQEITMDGCMCFFNVY